MTTRKRPAHAVARRATLAAGLVCAVGGWASTGMPGLVGGLVATAIVVAFLSTSPVPLFLTQAAQLGAGIGMVVLLLTFTLRLMLALLAFVLISRADFADIRWLGVTIVATALAWTAVHVWTAVRASRTELTIVPEASAGEGGG